MNDESKMSKPNKVLNFKYREIVLIEGRKCDNEF